MLADSTGARRRYSAISAALSTRDDAIFLAAHAPVPVERIKGAAAQVTGEAEILNALRSEIGIAGRNTLIAVTGDVGTGKSHAVTVGARPPQR